MAEKFGKAIRWVPGASMVPFIDYCQLLHSAKIDTLDGSNFMLRGSENDCIRFCLECVKLVFWRKTEYVSHFCFTSVTVIVQF